MLGAGSSRTAITRRQPFVAIRPPGDWERPSLSPLGYKLGGAFRPLQDLLGAQRPLLESTFRHKVPIAGKNHRLSHLDRQKKHRDRLSPSFRENKCFGISLYLSDLALFGDSNKLSTLLFYTALRVGIQRLTVVLQSAKHRGRPLRRLLQFHQGDLW